MSLIFTYTKFIFWSDQIFRESPSKTKRKLFKEFVGQHSTEEFDWVGNNLTGWRRILLSNDREQDKKEKDLLEILDLELFRVTNLDLAWTQDFESWLTINLVWNLAWILTSNWIFFTFKDCLDGLSKNLFEMFV